MCKQVADSGDVVSEKQGFSIFGTHELANAISPLRVLRHKVNVYSRRSRRFLVGRRRFLVGRRRFLVGRRRFLVGRHQGVRRFVSPGLHHTKVSKQSLRDVAC